MRHRLPPVRQLKIFYPATPLPASHKQKCANLLRSLIAMHVRLRIAERMSHDVDRSSAHVARVDFSHRARARPSRATHVRNPTHRHAGGVAWRSAGHGRHRAHRITSPPTTLQA
ncbi:hypothetical protein XdyCFBP7245_17065 [Xanthomonas dyei]|uniref:Uncharacterized protein n=1 Tax=Xanthomonas dyei TaxID=743699 RepID=A0A2S7BZB4_9XANT|nr:hypothetical protein XdyCFBP7245_17065 [Xanthomonas dyei]